jgi:hypothetical protein
LSSGRTTNVTELYVQWSNEPYGVKSGLYSFLMLAYIITRSNMIAVYRDGIYNAETNALLVDVLISNPKTIALKYIKSNNQADDIINIIITLLNESNKENILKLNSPPLIVAQNLVMLIDNLHPWVLKTKTLTHKTTQFRELIKASNDPNKLIFDDILQLFNIEGLYSGLKNAINELVNVYPSMIQSVGILLTSELDIPLATPTSLEKLRERAKNIKGVAGDFQIDAFSARLSTFTAAYNEIAGIISLANSKPPKDWIDLDIENAKKEIMHLRTEFKKAELYTKVKNRPSSRQAIAFISGIGGKSETITGEFDLLVDKKEDVEKLKMELKQLIKKEKNISLILTVLAETSIEYLKVKDAK